MKDLNSFPQLTSHCNKHQKRLTTQNIVAFSLTFLPSWLVIQWPWVFALACTRLLPASRGIEELSFGFTQSPAIWGSLDFTFLTFCSLFFVPLTEPLSLDAQLAGVSLPRNCDLEAHCYMVSS